MSDDPFHGFPLEAAIAERAAACGIDLDARGRDRLALHARRVLAGNARLPLTGIVDPAEFVERHVGEALEGAALLPQDTAGTLLDLGSGNGYPGVPIAVVRPGLTPLLVEASTRKAAFLEALLRQLGTGGGVLERHVQRAADLEDQPPVAVLVTRAMGDWERILPRLAARVVPGGRALLWAGAEAETVLRRETWTRYRLLERRALPGRDRSWIWLLEPAAARQARPEPGTS